MGFIPKSNALLVRNPVVKCFGLILTILWQCVVLKPKYLAIIPISHNVATMARL